MFALHTATRADFGTRWLETTGPASHIELLTSSPIEDAADEVGIYARFGLPWIAPEFRQGSSEIDFARSGQLDDVIDLADVQGELHSHTVWSDGVGTIDEMAESARSRGYRYLGISDHSHSLGVANGLDAQRLQAQGEAIREASARLGFPLFRSSEVEVLKDGALDFDDDTLRGLDVVIASTHTGLTRPRAELMARVHKALDGGRVDILAHPSGRLIEEREPGDFDWPEMFQIAKRNGVVLEINADPARLDLKAEHVREALETGNLIVINCDAHRPNGFSSLPYGIGIARRAFTPRDRVINSWDLDRLKAWMNDWHR
jgi:DNA polymerase (family 10)